MQALGCGVAEHEGHVQLLLAAKKDSAKVQKTLMDELSSLHGKALASQCRSQGKLCRSYQELS